ncbi:hypothetical protein ACRAWD_02245 [Caulobacter segnis]
MMGSGSLLADRRASSLALVVMGLVYRPLAPGCSACSRRGLRCTGSSIAFNVGGVIGGGMTPAIARSPGHARRPQAGRQPLSRPAPAPSAWSPCCRRKRAGCALSQTRPQEGGLW